VIVFFSATVEVNVATKRPCAFVVPLVGLSVFEVPLTPRPTLAPLIGAPFDARRVTVIVTFSFPSASALAGLATTSIASAAPASPLLEDDEDEDEDDDDDEDEEPEPEDDDDEDELPDEDPASFSVPGAEASSSPHPHATIELTTKNVRAVSRRMREE
jgi:hypothetical protein